jgi:caa(3)-type oxidase subunit IV
MDNAETHHPTYVTVWLWFIGLLIAGLFLAFVPIGKAMAIFLIFSVAILKASLVARHYMHLKSETLLIYAIAGIPLLLLIALALTLVPDVVFNR